MDGTKYSHRKLYLANSLSECIEEFNLRDLNLLVKKYNVDPNFIMPDKLCSPMHVVAAVSNETFAVKALELLFKCGADPNVCGDEALTPVHVAASWDHAQVIHVLLENGGNPHLKDECGKDAFDYALENRSIQCMEVLSQYNSGKLLLNLKKIQSSMPITSHGRRSRKFFRPSLLREIPGSSSISSSSNDNAEEVVCESSKSLIHDNRPTALTVCDEDSEGSDDSVIFLKEVSGHCSSSEECLASCAKVADSSCKSLDNVSTPKSLVAGVEDCYSATLSFGVKDKNSHLNPFLSSQNLSFSNTKPQVDASSVSEALQGMDINPLSCNDKSLSLRKSLMPKKPIPLIIVTPDTNDLNKEMCEGDNDLRVENLLSLSAPKTFDDKRLENWINNVTDNQPPDVKSEISEKSDDCGKPEISSDTENADSLSSCTFKTCDNRLEAAGVLNTGASGSLLGTSSLMSSKGSCMSECFLYTDEENGIVLLEERWRSYPVLQTDAPQTDQSCSSSAVPTTDTETCHTESLREELTRRGIAYGPITATTKKVYKKSLKRKAKLNDLLVKEKSKFSFELQRSLRDGGNKFFVSLGSELEKQVAEEFSMCGGGKGKKRWREGCSKTSFNYLLLDPRISENLPWRAPELAPGKVWTTFLESIFYVGKGKRSRPYCHLYEAVQHWNDRHPTRFINGKMKQIVDIWADGFGVICLHIFQNVIPVEAYTREAAMIDALGLDNLRNAKRSEYYGNAAQWISREQRILGVYLLYKAMTIFLAEGERQIRPWDLKS